MPLVSVIIPCYNDGGYLDESVSSIKAQTYTDTEIIIVNDGSDDPSTLQRLHSFNDPKITVLNQAYGHLSSGRSHGIRHAQRRVIVTLDADDKFGRTFIEKGMKVLQDDVSVGAVTCYLKSFGLKKYKWKPLGGDIKNFLY